jgi:intein/homing endonuclease
MRVIKDNLKKTVLKCLKQNKSLNQISRELNLNKTTVYYWYKKLGKSKITKINIDIGNNQLIGEFIGIFAGDGGYYLDRDYHHSISIYIDLKDKKYITHVRQLMLDLFSKNPSLFIRKNQNTAIVRMRSKDIYLFIKNYLIWNGKKYYSVHLKDKVSKHSKEFLKGFIRGVFDTDGFINRNMPRVVFGTVSKNLSNDVVETLALFKIRHTKNIIISKRKNRKPLILVEISRSNLNEFFDTFKLIH